MSTALQLLINIAIQTTLLGLVAAGFSVFYSVSGVQHLSHGAIITGAGYVFLGLLKAGAGIPLALLGALLSAVVVGSLCNFMIYERLQKRRWFSSLLALMSSLILLSGLQSVLLIIWGSQPRTIPLQGIHGRLEVFGASITTFQIFTISLALILIGAFTLYLKYSRLGLSIRATADNPEMAEIIGVSTRRVRYLTMGIISFLGGLAGVLIALEYNLDPYASTLHAVRMFARTIVAGVGSVPGVLASGLLIDSAENIGGYFISSSFKDAYSFILVFLFLLFRPQGLFGSKKE